MLPVGSAGATCPGWIRTRPAEGGVGRPEVGPAGALSWYQNATIPSRGLYVWYTVYAREVRRLA